MIRVTAFQVNELCQQWSKNVIVSVTSMVLPDWVSELVTPRHEHSWGTKP